MFDSNDPLRVEYLDGRRWKLLEPFSWFDAEFEPEGAYVDVPTGFVTDFASIPRAFWITLPPTGKYGKAAVIHDWLYYAGCVVLGASHKVVRVKRSYADKVFLRCMEELGVGWTRRHLMYLAVRAFGGPLWMKRQPEEAVRD